MSINLIASPDKLVNGLQSNVNAGRSQLPYTFQREDFGAVGFVDSDGGEARIYLEDALGDVTSEFTIGDLVYISNPVYEGIHTITAVLYNAPSTRLTINTPFTTTGSGTDNWVNNLTTHPNYKVDIFIADENSVRLTQDFLYSPAPDGSLFVDVSQILTEIQEDSLIASQQFILEYQEIWTDSIPAGYTSAPVVQSLYAEKQIFQTGGSNMWENLLNETPVGKLLTKFVNPLVWKGFRRTCMGKRP
jgi:hypothetical protein